MARTIALDTRAPDFTLTDYEGVTRSLLEYRNEKNVLLIFNRGFT